MDMSKDDNCLNTTPEITEKVHNVTLNLLPLKSREKYERQYELFGSWLNENSVNKISENILLAYFSEKEKVLQSPTLWSIYSMLKATIQVKKDIDISQFKKLTTFLKRKAVGYKPKKSKVLTGNEVNAFLKSAPDNINLLRKVVLIFGVAGSCSTEELTKLSVDDVEDKGSLFIVKVPEFKSDKRRRFIICNEDGADGVNYLEIVRNYLKLRPREAILKRLFLRYSNGACYNQPVGVNTIAKIPFQIAKFLKLSQPSLYTGNCFKRMSATLNAGGDITQFKRLGGWKSSTVAEAESYIDGSTNHEMTTESQNPAASAHTSFLSQTVEPTDDSSSALEYSNSVVWDPPSHPSELIQPVPTDTESCHELNRLNATDGYSGMDHMDDSASDTSDHDRDRPAGVMSDTLDLFGRYVASILQQLPVTTSYTLQQKFINEAISAKLDYEKDHPSKSPRQTMAESQPRSEYPTVNGFQPIIIPTRNVLHEEGLSSPKSLRNKKSRRSKKNKDPSPPATATTNDQLPLASNIKQERIDDFEAHEESVENTEISIEDCSRLDIEENLGAVKQEIQSDFELVICNNLLDQVTNDTGPKKLLQALQGDVKDKPPESGRQPITCSLCNSTFSTTSDLRLHFRNAHPGINHVQKTKRLSEEDSNSARLTLPIPSANPLDTNIPTVHVQTPFRLSSNVLPHPTDFCPPSGSIQKRPKLIPEAHENYMEKR